MSLNEDRLKERIRLEADRVGWTLIDLRRNLEIKFKKQALALLTESELTQFIDYLKKLPS